MLRVLMSGYAMVPQWLANLQPTANAMKAYVHLALRGTFKQGLGVYEECRPSMKTLAGEMKVSEPTARRAVDELVEIGAATRRQRWADDGSQLPSVYSLHFGILMPPPGVRGAITGDRGGYHPRQGGAITSEGEGLSLVIDNPEPNTQNPTPKRKKDPSAPAEPDLFDEFYKVYPAKKGRIAAKKAWAKAIKIAPPQDIIAGAMVYRTDSRVLAGYIKDPATWLNGGHWADELSPGGTHGGHRAYQDPADLSEYLEDL